MCLCLAITSLLCIVPGGSPFQLSSTSSSLRSRPPAQSSISVYLHRTAVNSVDDEEEIVSDRAQNSDTQTLASRRQILHLATQGALALSFLMGMPAASLAAAPSRADLKRLQLGHSRVRYLLENWDKLTESCNNKAMSSTESKQIVRTEGGGGGFCDKTPLVVQEYLGYKSTTDPLFKADAFMLKAVPLVDDSVMDEADYVDLVEQYRDKADQTSLLAYTSSWGEANPNGSKDATDDYLDKTKEVVMETEVLLRKILGALQLEVLQPSEKKA